VTVSALYPGAPFDTEQLRPGRCGAKAHAIGADIVSITKITAILGRHSCAAEKLFTSTEITYARSASNEHERFAARFAAKEAVLKALGVGMAKGMSWLDIEVGTVPSGRPILRLSGAVAERARQLGLDDWLISLAHCREFAVAYVCASGSSGSKFGPSETQQ
jgi:holo-[acyl-carrier protein] synthase